jgi:glutamate/aspartate transport system substrate-binding protein
MAAAGLLGLAAAAALPTVAHADRVTAAAQIHIGVQDQAMPFAYQLDDRHAGYTVEICQQVLAALEARRGKAYDNPAETRWFSVTPQTRLIRLLAGDIDLECSSTSQTPARTRLGLVFSLPIFVSDIGVLMYSPDGSVPASAEQWLAQMRGRRVVIVTTEGSTSVRHLTQLNSGPAGVRFEVVYGRDHADSLRRLRNHEADAFVMDRSLLAARLATDDRLREAGLVLPAWSPVPNEFEVYGLVMREADTDLQRIVQQTLCGLLRPRDGAPSDLQQLHERWFNQPIPLPGGGSSARELGLVMHGELLRRLQSGSADCP